MNGEIKDLINFLLILIPSACAARCVYCLILSAMNPDEAKAYRKRMVNAVIFTVIAECIVEFYNLISSYFGGGGLGR